MEVEIMNINIKNEIRRILFGKLSSKQIELFYKAYYRIRYPEEMEKKITCGSENSDLIFYVIRPRTDCTEGLLSLLWNVIKNIDYARENDYIPIVDFKNYKTQYWESDSNVWEKFFTQPTSYKLEDVYQSKNVILSGLQIQWYKKDKYSLTFEDSKLIELNKFIFENIQFSKEVDLRVKNEEI